MARKQREYLDLSSKEDTIAQLLHPKATDAEPTDRTTFPLPPSDLESRLSAFLPQLQSSNAQLTERLKTDPASVDIEQVEGPHIEMNLGLGVFDVKDEGQLGDAVVVHTDAHTSSGAAEPTAIKYRVDEDEEEEEEEEDDEEEAEEDEDEDDTANRGRRQHPGIKDLDQSP
ncbi:hypothetical protein BZG36_05165 [Bifiguratus adelaidae]|uniref:Uncharacterized protein n=1 Tax=Bifiguratus adelaidae TaxID=1938954 RepID=A0A261XU96_9FUNG|nr:hypothetical protein BZG36_05165 [Bifiguratus adelaidae]